jgi:hypothetical protein
MNDYLIPANSKKSQLYFGLFKGIDFVVMLIGFTIGIPILIIVKTDSILGLMLKLIPIAVTLFMVVPIAYYHNVRVFIKELYTYIMSPKRYYWRGWCATYDDSDDKQAQN